MLHESKTCFCVDGRKRYENGSADVKICYVFGEMKTEVFENVLVWTWPKILNFVSAPTVSASASALWVSELLSHPILATCTFYGSARTSVLSCVYDYGRLVSARSLDCGLMGEERGLISLDLSYFSDFYTESSLTKSLVLTVSFVYLLYSPCFLSLVLMNIYNGMPNLNMLTKK